MKQTIDYLKEMQESYIEGEGYERHPLPEWYALDKAIEALEQTRWIPVSEGLPKVADCYAVTRQSESDLIVSACYFDGINNWHNGNWTNYERNYLTDIIACHYQSHIEKKVRWKNDKRNF